MFATSSKLVLPSDLALTYDAPISRRSQGGVRLGATHDCNTILILSHHPTEARTPPLCAPALVRRRSVSGAPKRRSARYHSSPTMAKLAGLSNGA